MKNRISAGKLRSIAVQSFNQQVKYERKLENERVAREDAETLRSLSELPERMCTAARRGESECVVMNLRDRHLVPKGDGTLKHELYRLEESEKFSHNILAGVAKRASILLKQLQKKGISVHFQRIRDDSERDVDRIIVRW